MCGLKQRDKEWYWSEVPIGLDYVAYSGQISGHFLSHPIASPSLLGVCEVPEVAKLAVIPETKPGPRFSGDPQETNIMGSQFHSTEFDGKLTKSELTREYNLLVAEERYEYGRDPYSGTFATLQGGLRIEESIFDSSSEAMDYVDNNTDKYGSALAVRYRDLREFVKVSPTFNGKNFSHNSVSTVSLDDNDLFRSFGGDKSAKCIALEFDQGGSRFVLAYQLSDGQKDKIKAILEPCAEENRKFRKLRDELNKLLHKAGDISADFTAEDLKGLKVVRKELLKTRAKRDRLLAKLVALDERFGSKLYKSEVEDCGTKWFVGCWCSC